MKCSFDEIQNKYIDLVKYYMSLGYKIDINKSMKTRKTVFNIDDRIFELYLLFESSCIEGLNYPVQIASIIFKDFNKVNTYDVIQRYYMISGQIYTTEVNDILKYQEKLFHDAASK